MEWIFPSANHYTQGGYPLTTPGYDVSTPTKTRFPPAEGALSSRRELVELLQVEPLFDYLIQNGVLEPQDATDLQQLTSSAKANLTLLQRLEGSGDGSHLGLFVNALRQTGQHYLANLLDDSGHISPASHSHSPTEDGRESRHKGEVSVSLAVKEVQLEEGDAWISVSDLEQQIAELLTRTITPPAPPTTDPAPSEPEESPKKSCCFMSCFSSLFSRKSKVNSGKQKKKRNDRSQVYVEQELHPIGQQVTNKNHSHITSTNQFISSNGGSVVSTCVNTCVSSETTIGSVPAPSPESQTATSTDNLRTLINTIHKTSDELYAVLQDPESAAHTQILKYFEQTRGVLVLSVEWTEALDVSCICMTPTQVSALRRDGSTECMKNDVQNLLLTPELLQGLGVHGLKLDIKVNHEHLGLAETELCAR